jgi:lipoprotein-releasing system permease protein
MTFYLAKRFLSGTSRRSVLLTAALGIFFSSTFVLVSVGILAGFQNAYREAVLAFNAHVVVTSEIGFTGDEQVQVASILASLGREFPHEFSPYLFYETLMPTSKGMRPVILKGVELGKKSLLYPFAFSEFDGIPDGMTPVYAGAGIVDLQPAVGTTHELRLLTLKDGNGRQTVRYDRISVTGTFQSGLYQFDAGYVYLDLPDLRRRYFADDRVNGFEIRLRDVTKSHVLAGRLREVLPPEVEVTTWDELNGSLLEALRLERTTFFAVALLILSIGCVSVFGFNFLFFLQRQREFSILSLLGLSQARLRRLLNALSLAVGAIATGFAAVCAGFILKWLRDGPGISLDPNVYFVSRVPVHFELRWFGLFIMAAWILCFATSVLAGRVVLKRHLEAGQLSF